ncbi:DNA-binding domain-containing protein [Aurantimonas sp. A2-1-M11]|uniref:DNA-binding domain-containing protein n=1 Tax=Aurantimonas sp. A2-1-M11 TaxID=3113712 RepID=UPI002F923841
MTAGAGTAAAPSAGDFIAALSVADAPMPPGLTTHRGTRDARRFAVYRNNVHVGLVKALETAFPVVRRLVGEAFFRIMARAFVAAVKPASPVMLTYGHGFPDFVAGFAPAGGLPYLADIARLEVALSQAYHAAEATTLGRSDVAGLDPSRLAVTATALHPATNLVRSPHPVGTIWSNHQVEPLGPVTCWASEAVLVTRPEAAVRSTVLPPRDVPFVTSLMEGESLADAAGAAFAADAAFDFGGALIALVELGAVTGFCDRERQDA